MTVYARFISRPFEHEGVKVEKQPPEADWKRLVDDSDVVITHFGDTNPIIYTVRYSQTPHVVFYHGGPAKPSVVSDASLVVFNSFAAVVDVDVPSMVLHPPVWPEKYKKSSGSYITLMNCSREKGIKTFSKIAELMPKHRFLAVKGDYNEQIVPRERNVRTMEPQADVKRIYAQTRVILVPSEVETYGRVAVEALCSSIPVIAHPSPGIKEALGRSAFFIDRDKPELWVKKLKELDDPETYQKAVKRAESFKKKLTTKEDLELFCEAVESVA